MKDYHKVKNHIKVYAGESIRIIRKLQGLTQTQLSNIINIPQSTISEIEHYRIKAAAKTLFNNNNAFVIFMEF